jgi:hypothetical protein
MRGHISIATMLFGLLLSLGPALGQTTPTSEGASTPTEVVKEMTAPDKTVPQPDGSVAAAGGPALPTESWTSGCTPDKGDASNRQQGCEKSEEGKKVGKTTPPG